MASSSAIMAGMAYIKLTAQDAELSKALAGAQNKLKAFAKSVEEAGSKMAIFGTLATTPFIAATKVFADFDDQMKMVAAVTGATGQDFDMLTEKAKKLGRETSFTAAQVAEGMIALGRMGFSSKEIDAAIKPMMDLAKVTGTDLGQAAEIASNQLRVFRMDASKSASVVDLLAATANGSAQTLVDLGDALKMAGPQAAAAGEDIKDVCTNLGIMANMGIKGSLAGTALRKAYSQFASSKVQDFLKQYNIETVDANGNLRKMETIIYDLANAMQRMGSAEKIAFAEEVFDIRGSLAGLSLTADTTSIDAFKQKLDAANGSAQVAAEKMESGIGGALRRLTSAFEGVSIAIGEMLSGSIVPLAENFAQALIVTSNWVRENGNFITTLAGVAAGAAVLGTTIKTVAIAGKGLVAAFSPLTALLKTLDNLATGSKTAATAAAQQAAITEATEQQKTLAAETSAAKRMQIEAQRHMNEMKNAATEAAAIAKTEQSKLAALTANQGMLQKQLAESAQRVAAIQSEAANQVAAERQKIVAMRETGNVSKSQLADIHAKISSIQAEAEAQVAAETAKQTQIRVTNGELQAQIAVQKQAAAAAEATAAGAGVNAAQAASGYKAATAAVTTATAAEIAFGKSSAAAALIMMKKQKIVAGLISSKLSYAITSKTVGNVIMQTNIKTLATEMATAKGIHSVTIALYAKAVAAKVAAGAMAALRAIMTAIAAHPVTAVLIAMVAVLTAISAATSHANKEFRQAAESARKFAEEKSAALSNGDENRTKANSNFERLKQLEELSARGRLTAEEMAETEKLINSLAPYGAAHYAQLDKTTGQLILAADAQKKFNEAMKEAAIMELKGKIQAAEDETKRLNEENEQLTGYWNHTLWKQMTGGSAEAIAQIEKNADRISEIKNQQMADEKRLQALMNGDQNAVTGKEDNDTQANVDAENQRRAASVQELADAEKAMAKIEEDNASKKLSAFEKEIKAIEAVRAEYEKNFKIKMDEEQALLTAAKKRAAQNAEQKTPEQAAAFAKAMKDADEHAANIAALNQRMTAATQAFNEQTQTANDKENARIAKETKPYDNFLKDLDAGQAEKNARRNDDNRFESLLKQMRENGQSSQLNDFVTTLENEIAKARQEYIDAVQDAQRSDSENGREISDAEKETLNEMQRALKNRTDQLAGYREQIRQASENATESRKVSSNKQMAAFDAAALSALFDRNGQSRLSQEERVARATEESAKNSRQIVKNTAKGLGNVQVG